MALIKSENEKELELVDKLQKKLEKREKCERIHRILICSLAVLAIGAFFIGHSSK